MVRLRELTFKPTLIPSLVTLLLLPLLLYLGLWQLNRADQKETLQQRYQRYRDAPHVSLAEVPLSDPASRYRKVVVQGRYDSRHQILLDNKIENGQPGYHVYTPLKIAGEDQAILVNRGWIPLGSSRQQLPDVTVSDGDTTVQGRLSQPANPGLRLGGSTLTQQNWPWVVQYLDYDQLSQRLGYELMPAVILLDPDAQAGYRRDWRPHFAGFGPARHRGYALQWFSLAVALMVIYGIVNVRRRFNDR